MSCCACCTEYKKLGCFNFCDDEICTGIEAVEAGEYTASYILGNRMHSITTTAEAGENICFKNEFPLGCTNFMITNENGEHLEGVCYSIQITVPIAKPYEVAVIESEITTCPCPTENQ